MNTFRDIPQFPSCVWSCEYPIPSMFNYFESEDYGIVIPEYQRGLRWEESQKRAYLEYILQGGTYAKDFHFNAVGFMAGKAVKLEVIDGQQRLNALREFLDDKFTIFNGRTCTSLGGVTQLRRNIRWMVSLKVYELSPADVIKFYLALNTGGSMHTQADLAPAYQYLKKVNNDK